MDSAIRPAHPPATADGPCNHCPSLLGIDDIVIDSVDRDHESATMTVTLSTTPAPMGCLECGLIAHSRGRRHRRLIDIPHGPTKVWLVWRQKTWRCHEPTCPRGLIVEQRTDLAPPRAKLTTCTLNWAITQIRREHATIHGLARQLGTSWKTVWAGIRPVLQARAADDSRYAGVTSLGVDEHIWHHTDPRKRGPKELTGMVDLSRDEHGRVRARLLDLVPGRSGPVYADWLKERSPGFRKQVTVAALDTFGGYRNAIRDELADATAVLDAFHVVKLGTQVVDEVRRRVQQATLGHRGRKGDPLYGIATLLRAGAENLSEKQVLRLQAAIEADPAHVEVYIAWRCAQDLRQVYHHPNLTEAKKKAQRLVARFPTCPIPEVARLGRTPRRWKSTFLAYFTTGRSSNGGAEAINGIIDLHRRLARGFKNRENCRVRMLLAAGGLDV